MVNKKNKLEEELYSLLNKDARELFALVKALEINAEQRTALVAEIDKKNNLDSTIDPGGVLLMKKMEEDSDYALLRDSAETLRSSIVYYLKKWSQEYSHKGEEAPPPASNKTLN